MSLLSLDYFEHVCQDGFVSREAWREPGICQKHFNGPD